MSLTKWELAAIQTVLDTGPMPATSGSSATFDAAWELTKQGLMVEDYRKGPVYLRVTMAGLNAYYLAQTLKPAPAKEVMKILADEAGIERSAYKANTLFDMAIKLAHARGERRKKKVMPPPPPLRKKKVVKK